MKNKWEALMIFLLSNLWKSTTLKISVRKEAMQITHNLEKKEVNSSKKVDDSWKINFNTHVSPSVFTFHEKQKCSENYIYLDFTYLCQKFIFYIGIGRTMW